MTLKKKIFVSILAILLVVCAVIDIWFLYVKFYAPEKLIENTYELGLQETTDGETKSFVEVKYSSNENKNGLECLDIKFNYLLDENQNEFYSQGIQIVANEKTNKIDWGYYLDENQQYVSWSEGHWYNFNNKVTYYGYFGSYDLKDSARYFNYASSNDYEDTLISQNPINNKTTFRVQLGEDLYKLKFKGESTQYYNEQNLYATENQGANLFGNRTYYNYYFYNNIYSFAYKIFEGVRQSIANGKQSSVVFEFGDMFDYYKYDDEQGSYTDTAISDSTKVVSEMKSYYSILVYKTADGIRKASDSLFNCVGGNSTYNSTGDYSLDDYFIGRTIVECDIYDFQLVDMEDGLCALKLSQEFIQNYTQYQDKICLDVCIDKDILKEIGIEYFVFAEDSGLSNFEIYQCYQIETINGELVKTGVTV